MSIKCITIFKIKYNNLIYDVFDFSNYCKKKNLIIEEEIKKAIIIYDKKEFSYEEYVKDLKKTAKMFKPDKANLQYVQALEFVFLYDSSLYICLKYIGSLCENITAGNYYALESYKKIPVNLFGIKSYAGCYYRRCLDFSTSILWYDTAIDYFLQIFCAKYNLYSLMTKKDVSKMNYYEIAHICTYPKVIQAISKIKEDETNKEMFKVWKRIKKCNNNLIWITELSNSLKHKSGISYKNLNMGNFCEMQKGNEKMSDKYLSLWVDIDKDFDKIIESHNEIIKLYFYIVKIINNAIQDKKEIWDKNINIIN